MPKKTSSEPIGLTDKVTTKGKKKKLTYSSVRVRRRQAGPTYKASRENVENSEREFRYNRDAVGMLLLKIEANKDSESLKADFAFLRSKFVALERSASELVQDIQDLENTPYTS